ncbi:hypothetical protein [Streptomyces sp. UNOB3_S3]|uniref:hypothetical protein n=1 Tax=Streptomyces sp. UNOB3_S3 TaxID=2871682 RepID=UPI001E2BBC92|nr:hypothetical protein [Streptomyces sp. UNOB3_S3]MCC3775676.1 hypothetical protein [Streptomyces sp. UNOB3_S3]
MISFIASDKMTDRQIGSAAMLGFLGSFQGTGLSGATPVRPEQRPTKGSAVMAAAEEQARQGYALAAVANGAGSLNAAHHPMTWAFRGLKPWRDPA